MKKRILSVLLLCCMVLTLLPTAVFAAAVVITALCFRLRSKENRRKDGTDKPNRHEKEEKSQ